MAKIINSDPKDLDYLKMSKKGSSKNDPKMVIFWNVKIDQNWQKFAKKRDFCHFLAILTKKPKKTEKILKKMKKRL